MTRHEFEMAVLAVRPTMIRYAMDRLGNEQEAEDLVQQTLLEVHQRRSDFVLDGKAGREKATVQSWCIGRLKWRIKDVMRRRAREPEAVSVEDIYTDETTASDSYELPHQLIAKTNDAIHDVQEAVSLLPEGLRLVCQLIGLIGYTQQEVAKRLRLSRDQVARKVEKAYALLRGRLGDYGRMKRLPNEIRQPIGKPSLLILIGLGKPASDVTDIYRSLIRTLCPDPKKYEIKINFADWAKSWARRSTMKCECLHSISFSILAEYNKIRWPGCQ